MSATHVGKGDMFYNGGTQNICKDNGTQIFQTGPDEEARQARQCSNYMQQNGYDPADQKANAERQGGELFEPACQWIYSNPEFQQWLDGAEPPSLWLHGGPGKGKSMLLCSVINHLLESVKEATVPSSAGSDSSLLVTYSFFSDPDGVCEASFVVASLIYGLVKQQPRHLNHISKFYDHENKYPFKGKRSFTALEGILKGILEDNPAGARIILVVDALDECKTDLDRFLHLILRTSSLQNVRWLASSRGLQIIHQRFDAPRSKIRKLSLDQTGEDIQQAVKAYIHHQMGHLHSLRVSEEKQENLQNRLSSKAGGTFLWLSIVMAELENVASWDIDDVVEGLPGDLESLYEKLLQNLLEGLGHRTNNSLIKDVLHKTLATTAAALRPLYIEELKELADFPEKVHDTSQVEEVIDRCGAFLTRQNNQVFLIHFSAKQFLTPGKLDSAFRSGRLDIHAHLFSRSMLVMKEHLKRDIYNLQKPGIGIDEIDRAPSPDPLSRLKYSCTHWVDHLHLVQEKHPSHYQDVRCFIEKRLLYWLEAMSLQRMLSEVVKVIQKLRGLMQNTQDLELDRLTEDVRRFVLFQRHTIENYPLQTYISALIFTPTGSWIRKLYGGEEPEWISSKPKMETTWSTCIQKLPTTYVNELAFSTDGKLLAALSPRLGSGCLVDIWDLEGHGWVRELTLDFKAYALGFLATGGRLALVGRQNRFEIWNAETGSRLRTLRSPDEPGVEFTSLAVPDSTHISLMKGIKDSAMDEDLVASGSDNGAVRFWNATNGNCARNIRTSRESVQALTFSLDNQKLAVGLANGTVEVWDSRSEVLIWKLEGHHPFISSMVFFGEDQLVSAFREDNFSCGEAMIWDMKTGSCVKRFNKFDKVVSLGSSAGFVSSELRQPTIKIWNSKGDCVRVLEYDGLSPDLMAFSTKQQLLALSTDSVISIWDLKLDASIEPIPAHVAPIHSIACSSDGLLLASGSHDSIKIWDTTNCNCIRSIDCGGYGLAFSPAGRYLVSRGRMGRALESSYLTIWNVDSGEVVKRFPGMGEWEAFSPDGKLLALALDTPIVMIWDMDAAEQLHRIQCSATCLIFSADGHKLVLASDTNLEIWDMGSRKCIWTVKHQQSKVTSIALSADMRLLSTGTIQGGIHVWDIGAAVLRATLPSLGKYQLRAMAFSPNQDLLVWANDYRVEMCDWKNSGQVRFLLSLTQEFNGANFDRITLQFNHANSPRLCTRIGDLDIGNVSDGRVHFHGYHLHEDGEWIARCNERMVLLPVEYQWPRAVNVRCGKIVAIGTDAGRVLLFRFV